MVKHFFINISLVCIFTATQAQHNAIQKPSSLTAGKDTAINKYIIYGNKKMPLLFAKPIKDALSYYPELKDTKITWRIKHSYTPLGTSPSFSGLFRGKNKRSYIITISDKTIDTLTRLLYINLSYQEQVGIMGHELGHVVDFKSKNLLQSARNVLGHLSQTYIDSMEYHTDMICIAHGLGKQLEAYSIYVRTNMHVHDWRGVDNVYNNDETHERYMNPDTIEKYMKAAHAKK